MFDCCEHILKARRLARAVSKFTRVIDWYFVTGVYLAHSGLNFLSCFDLPLRTGSTRTRQGVLVAGYVLRFSRESEAVRCKLVALVLPHRFDGGVQPLSRILDISLIRNHDRFDV